MRIVIVRRAKREWITSVTPSLDRAMELMTRAGGDAERARVETTPSDAFPLHILEDARGFTFPSLPDGVHPRDWAEDLGRQGFSGALYVVRAEWTGAEDGSDEMGRLEHYHFG